MAHQPLEEPAEEPYVLKGEVVNSAPLPRSTDDFVHRVTSARQSTTENQRARTRRYLLSMALRTACFIGAVVAWSNGAPAWLTWGFVAGAAVLPYIAVVMANAGARPDNFVVAPVKPLDLRALPGEGEGLPGPRTVVDEPGSR